MTVLELEMEVLELKGKIEVMKHLGDDAAVQSKINMVNENLKEKNEELESWQTLYQELLLKEHASTCELVEARNELIMV